MEAKLAIHRKMRQEVAEQIRGAVEFIRNALKVRVRIKVRQFCTCDA